MANGRTDRDQEPLINVVYIWEANGLDRVKERAMEYFRSNTGSEYAQEVLSSLKLGRWQANEQYMSALDDRIHAAGGSKSVQVLSR